MGRHVVETVLGGFVLLMAGGFLVFAYDLAQVTATAGYPVNATFLNVGGLERGADVRISGVKVGTVLARDYGREDFDARVVLSLNPDVKLPADTMATIDSEGILGGKYVRLTPGRSPDIIPEGGRIAKTEDFKSLEEQVAEIIFLATGAEK